LRRAARAANPTAPAAFRPIALTLGPLAVRQRYQAPTASLRDAVYHLVDKADARRYLTVAAGLRMTHPRLAVTGPFPPFAFAPEIL
jgi:hypothetical protein